MASGILQVKYSEAHIAFKAAKANIELDGISNRLSGVSRKISGMPERSRSGDNLSKASAFLNKKTQQFESRQRVIETLKERNNTFMSHVETTENRLSSQIRREYKEFHKQTGIGKSRAACFLDGLVQAGKVAFKLLTYLIPGYGAYKAFKDLWQLGKKAVEAVKEWYNNLPEGVRFALKAVGAIAVAVVAVIACVASFGAVAAAGSVIATVFAVCSAAGATITALDKIVDAVRISSGAFSYFTGNKAIARELDTMSAAEYINLAYGIPVYAYNNLVGFGNLLSFIGGAGSFTVNAANSLRKAATSSGSVSKLLKDQVADTLGIKPVNMLKDYVQQNGFKGLLTSPIKLTNTAQIEAFKGIKSAFEWGSFTTLGKLDQIISAPASFTGAISATKGTLEFLFDGELDMIWPTPNTGTW